MKFSTILKFLGKWIFRGGLVGLPLAFSSTLALDQHLTWIGALLLWFYTGRIIRQQDNPEKD